jgi:gamma-glutamylcyclotransferase (GGCT)/AIG2-like uncharacterized protein YtfP
MNKHVFTYGTLMFPEVWQLVVGRPFATVAGVASGFATYRVANAVFPGMLATTNSDSVRGLVYLDVDSAAIARLDQFEDDFYRRLPVQVKCDDGRICDAETYIVPPEKRGVLTDRRWSRDEFVARGDLQKFIARFAGFGRLNLSD